MSALVQSAQAQVLPGGPPAVPGTVLVCSMRVGREVFGIDSVDVHEVLGECTVHPVPLAPSVVGGVLSYRGDVLPVICLRRLLRMPAAPGPAHVLVLRDEEDGAQFGLAVDEVHDVLHVDGSCFKPNPCTLDARRRILFAGAWMLRDVLIVRLLPQLLRPARLVALHERRSTQEPTEGL